MIAFNEPLLHIAIHCDNVTMVGKLIKKGENIGKENLAGLNSLHFAVLNGSYDIVELLTKDGSYINSISCKESKPLCQQYSGYTPLHINAEQGDVRIGELLIARGADKNATIIHNTRTPLHIAVLNGQTKIVDMLLKHGCDVDVVSGEECTPLLLAVKNCGVAKYKHVLLKPEAESRSRYREFTLIASKINDYETNLEIIKLLLNYNCNVNLLDKSNRTALHIAALNNHTEIVEQLVIFGGETNLVDKTGNTPFHYACRCSNKEAVEVMLKYRYCSINFPQPLYGAPLHIAAANSCPEILEILLERGAAVDQVDPHQNTALHIACSNKCTKVVRLLLKFTCNVNVFNKYNSSPLHYAARSFCPEIVEMLLKYGAKLNETDLQYGNTPLHIACKWKQVKTVKLLLRYGSEVDIQNKECKKKWHFPESNYYSPILRNMMMNNWDNFSDLVQLEEVIDSEDMHDNNTPLHIACKKRNIKIVKLLLKSNCDVNIKNKLNQTALQIAIENNSPAIVELLLNCDADVQARDYKDCTPLHNACKNNNKLIIQLLLQASCDVNAKIEGYGTAMHIAVENNKINIVKMLINYGADVDIIDACNGNTALHIACEKENIATVMLLLKHCCNVNVQNLRNKTALQIAIDKENTILMELLLDYGCDINPIKYLKSAPKESIAKIFFKYIIKVQMVSDRYASRRNVTRFDESKFPTCIVKHLFQKTCRNELKHLKKLLVGGTSISLYNILKKNVNQLVNCLRNERIMDALETKLPKEVVKSNVQLYGNMIKLSYFKAMKRISLLDPCFKKIRLLFHDLPILPDVCIEHILNLMSNKDLLAIIET